MKKIILLLLVLHTFAAYPGNWDLFPLNQKSYYYNNSNLDYKYVDLYLMDSVLKKGIDSILYFRKNLKMQKADSCFYNQMQVAPWLFNNENRVDSLVKRNDTIFYYSNLSTSPFYFLLNAIPGQSWSVISTYTQNDYNKITISYSGIQMETFLGIIDSVKTYTLSANGTSANQIPISNFVIKLSKNHGLVEFVPFILFLKHPHGVNFYSLKLIGIENDGISKGYKQPKFADYFHLSVGDVLMWERDVKPPFAINNEWKEYYRDSITQSVITSNSVFYSYNRRKLDTAQIITNQNNLSTSFTKNEFENIVEAPSDWFAFSNNRYLGMFMPVPEKIVLWQTNNLILNTDTITGDTITAFSFSSQADMIDTANCDFSMLTDVMFSFSVDNRAGVTKYSFYNFGWDITTLIGSKINNQQIGSIDLSVKEEIIAEHLKIHPNPSSDFIYFENFKSDASTKYQIYNNIGQIYKQGVLNNNKVDITCLNSGFYFISITNDKSKLSGKFIKL